LSFLFWDEFIAKGVFVSRMLNLFLGIIFPGNNDRNVIPRYF
jgi:hypothetical protein